MDAWERISNNTIRWNPEEVGEYVNIKKLGLEPKQIFVGTSCEEKNKGRLVEIAKSKSILINEMYLDEFTSRVWTQSKTIILISK